MSSTGAIRAGRAFVEIGADTNPLTKGLKSASKQLNAYASRVAGIGTKMFAVGAAILAPFAMAINAGSDMEETMNKFNVVFGKNAEAVKEWGDTYGAEVGRSKRQIADFMGSNQDLLVPMGFEEGAATEMSKQITKLSVDLASFNNKADGDVLNDLQAALTGSGEVMKKYGVIVSQAAVNQELLNMGMDPKTATEAEKAQARFNIILRGTTAAQGDAERSANSWANQKKALFATIENVSGAIGKKLLPIVTPLLTEFKNGVQIIGDFIVENAGLVFAVAGLGAALVTLGGIALATALALKVAAVAATILGTVISVLTSPITLVVAGLAAVIYYSGLGSKALDWLADRFDWVGEIGSKAFGPIKEAMKAGKYKLAAQLLWAAIKVAWLEGTAKVNKHIDDWKDYILDKWNDLKTEWGKIISFFTTGWKTAIEEIKTDWLGFQEEVKGPDAKPADEGNVSVTAVTGQDLADLRKELKKDADKPAKPDQIHPAYAGQRKEGESQAEKEPKKTATVKTGLDGKLLVIDDDDSEDLKKAKQDFNDLVKQLGPQTVLPDAKDTNMGKNAAAGGGGDVKATANTAARTFGTGSSSGGVDLRSGDGVDLIADLINRSGEDKTLEELRDGNAILASMYDVLSRRLLKSVEVDA
ncbi:hypothetical protein [Gimesia sp.]|uniref:hypothetical protein n=1 Tax=Gimesia sp. TaxID=2024833 RepID=UPI003A91AFBC